MTNPRVYHVSSDRGRFNGERGFVHSGGSFRGGSDRGGLREEVSSMAGDHFEEGVIDADSVGGSIEAGSVVEEVLGYLNTIY